MDWTVFDTQLYCAEPVSRVLQSGAEGYSPEGTDTKSKYNETMTSATAHTLAPQGLSISRRCISLNSAFERNGTKHATTVAADPYGLPYRRMAVLQTSNCSI